MLDKEIKIVIGHKACLGAECLYCKVMTRLRAKAARERPIDIETCPGLTD